MNINRCVIETARDTSRRHAANYVTERERRFVAEIRGRQKNGITITPAQIDFAANIEAVLRRRGEVA